ncbi:MAG TPA: hypothetical protein EYQ42_08805 [Thiotrichaceae bacterium]|nr:hypothetical protein [Thiotrichaceae bacterium]HIM08192.1 hypothetical protein [Gammaproteobacteria bacterium]
MNNIQLPFAHLNLRFNPFGELTRQQRAVTAIVELEDLPEHFSKRRIAIQFVGKQGRGKSTHLIALHKQFNNSPYTQIYIGDKPTFNSNPFQFIDSIELLPASRRKKLYSSIKMLAITTHNDLTKELQSAGFKVISNIISVGNEQKIKKIFDSRIELARRNIGSLPHIDINTVRTLITKFNDDIRAMEHHLYDVFQQLQEIGNVKV